MLKQMKILSSNNNFNDQDRSGLIPTIYGQIMSTVKILVTGAAKLDIELEDKNKACAKQFVANSDQIDPPPSFSTISATDLESMKTLWKDTGIQKAFLKRSQMSAAGCHIPDSTKYFLDQLDRISEPNYLPNDEDILRCRVKTVSMVEYEIIYKEVCFKMFDVGGQKNERRKWLYMFADVTAIIFCVALSEYDLCLREDIHKNRMLDALDAFKSICERKILKDTCIILFLNKEDEFREKIVTVDPKVCFPDYNDGCNFQPALEFIQNKFRDVFSRVSDTLGAKRTLYIHVTTATSTQLMDNVMKGVKDIILQKVMRSIAPTLI